MNDENIKILKHMHDSMQKEYLQELNALEEKQKKIMEIDTYLDSLLDKEQSDLQVFLPRRVEDVYFEVIEKNKSEREKISAESMRLEKQITLQKNIIDNLEQILSENTFALHVKQLSVLDIQEKERQRIARDLHDSSLQDLAHLIHQTELASLCLDQDIVKAKLELASIEKGLKKIIDDVRNYIFNIRPISFDDLGLKETLENLFPIINQDNKFIVKTDIDNVQNRENPNTEITLITIYRIIQECFQNAVKHSDGTEIFVSLKENQDNYRIVVHDNGKGLDIQNSSSSKKHFGLSVIRERVFLLNGKIQIDTKDGTMISIEVPKKFEESL